MEVTAHMSHLLGLNEMRSQCYALYSSTILTQRRSSIPKLVEKQACAEGRRTGVSLQCPTTSSCTCVSDASDF